MTIKIKTLRNAGFGYKRIANQLELKAGTVKKHCPKLKSIEGLPPKIKQYYAVALFVTRQNLKYFNQKSCVYNKKYIKFLNS
jgi:hypothetical protein